MSIYKKLAEAKKEIGKISKDSTNPFFKSKYFDINSLLEHVEPILEKYDILILQPIEAGYVYTTLVHINKDNDEQQVSSFMKLPELNDPQKLGSAITYYRRYTLQSLLALQAEDDDANKASGNTPKKNMPSTMPWLNEGSDEFKDIQMYIENGKLTDVDQITKFRISKKVRESLTKLIQG